MGVHALKPLQRDPERKTIRFGACDIESYKWKNFRVIGLAWKTYSEEGDCLSEQYLHFLNLHEFVDFIFSQEFSHDVIFAHFGGRFDFLFLLEEFYNSSEQYRIGTLIPRGSGLLCFDVCTFTREDEIPGWCNPDKDVLGKSDDGKYLIRNRTINFRDSSAMLPFGLASLTDNFGVEHKKREIDFDTFEFVTDEMLEYLEYDCWGLYEVIERYFNWDLIKQAGPAMTVASQALRVFRTFIAREIPAVAGMADMFVRSSYYGGRTEIFKPFFEQHKDDGMLRSYDVNSLYPYIMLSNEFPGSFKYETQFYKEDVMGFYDVEVTVPDMYVPPLGICYAGIENKFIFPTGTFRGMWSTLELNYAMSLGVKINKVYRGCVFSNIGPIFKGYIESLYDMRKKAVKGSVDDILCKLIMNSTYGRFGLNVMREQLVLDQGQLGVSPIMERLVNGEGRVIQIRLAKQEKILENSYTNVAIASQVTSGARVHMHKLIMQAPDDMYYMDTDSLKTTHIYPRNDSALGELKLERKQKLACYLSLKTYLEESTDPIFKMFDSKGKEVKGVKSSKTVVMKGFDKRKIANFTKDDFTSALEGDMRRLQAMNPEKMATLRTAIRRNEFLSMISETPRQLRTRYNKRRIVKRAWAQVYDTEPLHIKDGEITNLDKNLLKKWKKPTVELFESITQDVLKGWEKEAIKTPEKFMEIKL